MIDNRRILTAGATLVIAASVGLLMQYGSALAARFKADKAPQVSAALPADPDPDQPSRLALALPTPPPEAVQPPQLAPLVGADPVRLAAVSQPIDLNLQSDAAVPSLFSQSCNVSLSALPAPGAMVRLSLRAPCYQNQRITISYSGLEFADATAADGSYTVEVPALSKDGPFLVTFADGRNARAQTLTLTLDGYERAAIMWEGGPALQLHAMEFGAGFNDAGHVWAKAPRTPDAGVRALGGFLVQLGNPDVFNPKMAEVYSFPYDRVQNDGTVNLIVEAELSKRTCGQSIAAKTFQLDGSGTIATSSLALDLPACDGEDGYLVLKNLLQDLKIARN
jgi:hypothetical protein